MHCLYFVKIQKEEAASARAAIDRALSILEAENFAGNEGGYWGGGKGDWFVMGGRWSGIFSGLPVNGDFDDEVLKLVRSNEQSRHDCLFVTDAECKKYAEEIQTLWVGLGGKNVNPYARDNYKLDGYDDDAAVVSAELIAALQKKFPKDMEYYDSEAYEEKSLSMLSTEDIGHWLVAVDYHF